MADYLFDGEETIATLVCGVDEAGRGPLAGPVVAAAVILNPDHPIEGLRDSKKLTAHAREVLAEQIKTHALAWAIAESSVADIDLMNILQATMAAMRKAVLQHFKMVCRTVSRMLLKAVFRIHSSQDFHQGVPIGLGQDGGCGNFRNQVVALDNRLCTERKLWQAVPINQD